MLKIIVGFGILIIALGILLATDFVEPQNPQELSTITEPTRKEVPAVSVFAQNLEVPWALAFLPDGRMLVTERAGRIRLINKNGNFDSSLLLELSDIKQIGESGLHGIALHPNFEENRYIYIYYTYEEKDANTNNKVVRYEFRDNKFLNPKIIVDKIPGAIFHDGGRIKFGPDGYLYITTGDAQNPSLSQNRNSLAGKILRVDTDGNPAPDNPFADAKAQPTRIYSYGHRNPQGLAWENNILWSTEHGQSAQDEINRIEKGKNYGWPQIRGDEKRTGIESPTLQSGADTWAPSGAAFFNDSIFFAGLRGEALYEYKIDEQKLVEHFKNEFGRLREVVVGPDNMLYVTTSNRDGRGNPQQEDDKILRIDPSRL